MGQNITNWIKSVLMLSAFLVCVCLFSLSIGTADISLTKLTGLWMNAGSGIERSIVFDVRIPRILLGIAVGGALSLAGVLLQGVFRNSLVEPYTLGISGGASVGVCINIIFKLNRHWPLSLPVSGLAGALSVIFFLFTLTIRKGYLKTQGLLLTGVMISFICSSLVMFIMAVSKTEDLRGIIFWIMGSLEQPDSFLINTMLAASLFSLIISYFFCRVLNALCLGEEEAMHLGINVNKVRGALFFIASLLTGFSVSIAGVIGFIGLVIPHFIRLVFGVDHKIVLIASYITGAAFLVLCDTLARTIISPLELPVGVITGLIGGVLFVYALGKRETS